MKKKWINNWGLKLIAVISAVLIWLLIMNNTDPESTFTVTGIPIEFVNEQILTENNMVYEVEGSKTVSVSVTTRSKDRREITAKDFRATVDLGNIYGVTSNVEVKVELIGDAALVRSWAQLDYNVRIVTEDVVTREFAIEVVQEGQVEDGYDYRQCTLSSNTVKLTAAESKLNGISAVKAVVDVSQSSESATMSVPLQFYNTSGREIRSLSALGIDAEMQWVDVDVVVQKTSPVSLDVVVNNKDKVAEGFRYITYRISHQSISVIGSMQAIAGLDKIQIEVDAEGVSGDVTKEIDIRNYLPENVTVAGDETLITIQLDVEPEGSVELEVPSGNVRLEGQDGYLDYFVQQPFITVNVFGLESDWEDLEGTDVRLIADVSGMGAGGHLLAVTPEEIEGLVLTVVDEVHVMIMDKSTEMDDPTGEADSTTEADGENDPTKGTDESDSELETENSAQVGGTESDVTEESATEDAVQVGGTEAAGTKAAENGSDASETGGAGSTPGSGGRSRNR